MKPEQQQRKELVQLHKETAMGKRRYIRTIQAENKKISRAALAKQTRKLAFKLGRYGMNLQLLGEHGISQHDTALVGELQTAANRLHMLSVDIQWGRRELNDTLGK